MPYTILISEINDVIRKFNIFLANDKSIPLLSQVNGELQSELIKVVHGNWNAFPFPNAQRRGVYFAFGKKQDTSELGLYIGKASFNSTIGKRLYSHLRIHADAEFFTMKGANDQVFIIEYLASIDLDALNMHFMASSLEEYLISNLTNKLPLMNVTGANG